MGVACSCQPEHVTMVTVPITTPCTTWIIPQTDRALKQCPQRLFWEACDTQEIQELLYFKVMHACLDSELPKTTDGRWPRL